MNVNVKITQLVIHLMENVVALEVGWEIIVKANVHQTDTDKIVLKYADVEMEDHAIMLVENAIALLDGLDHCMFPISD